MRSRFWSVLVRQLPFPFRQIGRGIEGGVHWLDETGATIFVGFHRMTGFSLVVVAGVLALLLSVLLFTQFSQSHNATLSQLAIEGKAYVAATRSNLERSHDWSTQDRWRLAHMFLDHRPPRHHYVPVVDSRLVLEPIVDRHIARKDFGVEDRLGRSGSPDRRYTDSRFGNDDRSGDWSSSLAGRSLSDWRSRGRQPAGGSTRRDSLTSYGALAGPDPFASNGLFPELAPSRGGIIRSRTQGWSPLGRQPSSGDNNFWEDELSQDRSRRSNDTFWRSPSLSNVRPVDRLPDDWTIDGRKGGPPFGSTKWATGGNGSSGGARGKDARMEKPLDSKLVRPRKSDPEVRLDLAIPAMAMQDKRLTYNELNRPSYRDSRSSSLATPLKSRDSRLLVQAEWEFNDDCREVPRQRPVVRRNAPRPMPEPIPEPRWVEPPPPIAVRPQAAPDLDFRLELLRAYLPSNREFPPGSQVAMDSAKSRFLQGFDHAPSPDGSGDRWTRFVRRDGELDDLPQPYVPRVRVPDRHDFALDSNDHELSRWPSYAEVALRLELHDPKSAASGKTQDSAIHVRNVGSDSVVLLHVRESLRELATVIGANPDGRIDREELERDLSDLAPGEEQRLNLTWWSGASGRRWHRATVIAHAVVGALTEVVESAAKPEVRPAKRPDTYRQASIRCDVAHLRKVYVDDVIEVEIVVWNTGEIPLHDVRVAMNVPKELRHAKLGREITYSAGTLSAGANHRNVLKLIAVSGGMTNFPIVATSREEVDSTAKAAITVVGKPPLPEEIRTPGGRSVPRPTSSPRLRSIDDPGAPPANPRPVPTPQPEPRSQAIPAVPDPMVNPASSIQQSPSSRQRSPIVPSPVIPSPTQSNPPQPILTPSVPVPMPVQAPPFVPPPTNQCRLERSILLTNR